MLKCTSKMHYNTVFYRILWGWSPPPRFGTELFKSETLQYNALRTKFPDRLIYRGGYTTWPSCSPDLTLYDLFRLLESRGF